MKILFETTTHAFHIPPFEAIMKQIWVLARELSAQGFQCDILALKKVSRKTKEQAKKHGVKFVQTSSMLAPWKIISEQFDVLHVFAPLGKMISSSCIASKIAQKVFGTPTVFTVYNSRCNHFWRERILGIPLTQIYRFADNFTVFSQKQADLLKKYYPTATVAVLPPISDRPSPQTFARTRHPTILFFGDFRQHKGVFDLIPAFHMVRETWKDAQLVLCIRNMRNPSKRKAVEKYITNERLKEHVVLKGIVNPWHELQRCWVIVYPFHETELVGAPSIPLTLIEAMKMGTPLVTTDSGAINEFFNNDIIAPTGSPTILGQKILSQLENQNSSDSMFKAPIAQYQTDNVIKQYISMYDHLDNAN